MTKKMIITVLALVICIFVLTSCNDKVEFEEVLPAQTVTISTVAELIDLKNYLGEKYRNFTFELLNDIDLSAVEKWEPIGSSEKDAFCAGFDGKGFAIKGLTVKGWDNSGNPLYISKDKGLENVTSYGSMALFGYAKKASFSNIKIEGVDMKLYTEGACSYVAGLVGYNIGNTLFNNISVNGNIELANIYYKEQTYDNKGELQSSNNVCDMIQYIGGIVGYSDGGEFKNLRSNINIDNENYYAYFQAADEENQLEEKYLIHSYYMHDTLPNQTFVGGIAGIIKNANATDNTSTASMKLVSKSVCAGGGFGAAYGCTIEDLSVNNARLTGLVSIKNTMSAGIALLTNTTFKDSDVEDAMVECGDIGSNVKAVNVGGAVGYAYDGSVVTEIDIERLTVKISRSTSEIGGIAGVIRDSNLFDCEISDGKIESVSGMLNSYSKYQDYEAFYADCAAIVSSVYGNAKVFDCEGAVKNHYNYTNSENVNINEYVTNDKKFATEITTSYVNEDGKTAVRFYAENSNVDYVVAYATYNAGTLNLTVYSEESQILSEILYTNVVEISGAKSDSDKYKDIFFTAGKGIIGADGNPVSYENRDMTKYTWKSGIPDINEATLVIK